MKFIGDDREEEEELLTFWHELKNIWGTKTLGIEIDELKEGGM